MGFREDAGGHADRQGRRNGGVPTVLFRKLRLTGLTERLSKAGEKF